MSKKKTEYLPVPKYTVIYRKDYFYLRARLRDADGKYFDVYAKTEEELAEKVYEAKKKIEAMIYDRTHPTVAEYSRKWLQMHSARVTPQTIRNYENMINKYINGPLGDMYLCEVTPDDIKLAMIPVSKKTVSVYNDVNMLVKCIFCSAEQSGLITQNPARRINPRGGVPGKKIEPLTDEQVTKLLETIRDLPPYLFVMIGLYAGLRREEILALQWDCVHLDDATPYISVRRTWHSEKNRPVITDELKTPSSRRDIPIPGFLAELLKEEKEKKRSLFVISDMKGEPLSEAQFRRLWNYIKVRSTQKRVVYKYTNGQKIRIVLEPELGQRCFNRPDLVYSLDFSVRPHQLRHTYITNLIAAGVDPKTVQYLAGHKNSKITMDIYAKAKYNKPEQLSEIVNSALKKQGEK